MHHIGVTGVMLTFPDKSSQPAQAAWSCKCLTHKCAITLGYALDNLTLITYNSHLQSYLSFCKLHSLPLNPTPDTLSVYVVFMCHHIKPISVMQYLSGIVNSLEPCFPDVRNNCPSILVTRMLAGMRKLCGFMGTQCKCALTEDDLITLFSSFDPTDLNDIVFVLIVLSSFHALLCLGKTTQPDSRSKCSFRKTTLHHSVKLTPNMFSFTLPTHKANHYFESSTILIESHVGCLYPPQPFLQYLTA